MTAQVPVLLYDLWLPDGRAKFGKTSDLDRRLWAYFLELAIMPRVIWTT